MMTNDECKKRMAAIYALRSDIKAAEISGNEKEERRLQRRRLAMCTAFEADLTASLGEIDGEIKRRKIA